MKKHSMLTRFKNKIFTAKLFFLFLGVVSCIYTKAQNRAAVMQLDAKGIVLDPQQLSSLLRIELERTNVYQVMDKYDVEGILAQQKIETKDCFSKTCLVAAGKALGVDKVFSGSIERFDERLLVTLRVIDVKTGNIDKTQVDEFINAQPEIQQMIGITLRNMMGLKNDKETYRKLTQQFDYETAQKNPGSQKLPLSGPRMGMTFLSGSEGKRLTEGQQNGGYDAFPIMSQFGYQFETQYLSQGNFQAIVELIPTLTGIDQGFFLPSLTLLNGFRNSRNGLEFAFGPALGFVRRASGYYENNAWHMESEWDGSKGANPNPIVNRLDSRGDIELSSGFVFAVGKTFKSGALNIPVNLYVIPGRGGARVGLSFGFNLKK